ncbi:MAG: AMIN domain-containing protein [Cyanobacteria bacterium P01_A01_bin.45]
MKQLHGNSLLFGTTAAILLVSQPVWAQKSEITGVKIKRVDGGVNLVLKTSSGSRPQVFTTKRGTSLVADIINTQLKLPKGRSSFSEENPVPGISSIVVNQLDANSVRVIVTGSDNVPVTQPVGRAQNSLTLNFASSSGNSTANSIPISIDNNSRNSTNQKQAAASSNQKPLVPNPEITIDNTPAQPAGPGQPSTQAPPFLPRAVAPPVGDIAIANIDASPSVIDLGTQQRVPRLVLRDAPVREVLSLLSRAAGLNLAYTNGSKKNDSNTQENSSADGPTISLDINDEPVQDVFNYVLRLSGLQANRSGRTIFVGPDLPNSTRDMVMRNIRLNQVSVPVALNFLVGLGAESAVSRERQVTSVSAVPVGTGAAPITQTQTTTETKIERLTLEDSKYTKPILRGLQALGDERTNSLTLIGDPKQVQMAMAQLTQLDIRRRQVAVNVKVVDVRLSNIKDFDSSFSFGVGDNFFSVDSGTASANFGGVNPPSSDAFNDSNLFPRVTGSGLEGEPFLDAQPDAPYGTGTNQQFANPQGQDGNVQTYPIFDSQGRQIGVGSGTYPRPSFGTNENPFQPGVTAVDEETVTYGLPSLFEYPKKFLATLQAQVQSGNAKILTDPTLIVQEGQQAQVNLTQEVVGNITIENTDTSGSSRQTTTIDKEKVGLTLGIKVERIDDNGFVSLSVAPTVSSPSAPVTTDNGQIILISERSLQSGLVRLRDGQTLILSGIIQDEDRTSVTKVPILGDIPLLGALFRKTNKSNERNEVIVMLTPQIMDDSQRSSYGYNYNPSPSVRKVLQRRGLKFPKK